MKQIISVCILILSSLVGLSQTSNTVIRAKELSKNNQTDKAVLLLQNFLASNRHLKNIEVASAYLELADELLIINQTDSLESYYHQAYEIFDKAGRKEEAILAKTGTMELQRRTNPSAAMEVYRQLLNQTREFENKNTYYLVLDKIITVNYAMENYDDAIKLCHESIAFYLSTGDTLKLAVKYRALANIYFGLKPDSAMHYYQKALVLLQKIHMYRYMVYSYQSMGWLNLETDVNKGLFYLNKADSLDKQYHIESPQLPLVLSFALAQKNDYAGAIRMAHESMRRGLKNKQLFIAIQSSDALSNYFKLSHQCDSALFYKEQSAIINDSIRSQKHYRDAVKMQTSLEYEKELFEKELTEKEMSKRQTLTLWFASAAIILLLIIATLIYRAFRKSKHNEILFERKNHEKAILLGEIHHRVKNNLALVSGMLDLQQHFTKDQVNKDIFKDAKSRINSMVLVHKNLYEQDDFIQIDTQKYFENLYQNIWQLYHSEIKINANINCSQVNINLDTLIPLALLSNELLTNSFKYAFAGRPSGEISIELKETESGFEFIYADNGAGINKEQPPKKGMGSMLMEGLIKQLHGKLNTPVTQTGVKYIILFTGIGLNKK